MIIGVRDHSRLGGTTFFARISPLCPRKVEYIWAMHFCLTWGGGGKAEWLSMGHHSPQRGRVWEGVFFWSWVHVLNIRFWVHYKFLINIKSSSKCIWLQYKGWGKPCMLLLYWTVEWVYRLWDSGVIYPFWGVGGGGGWSRSSPFLL